MITESLISLYNFFKHHYICDQFLLLHKFRFQELGLEKGWGDCAHRAHETIHLLLDLLEAPDPSTLEKFLGTIPMVFNVVILSPHGYFAQANVLGYPDTGGQVKSPTQVWQFGIFPLNILNTTKSFYYLFSHVMATHRLFTFWTKSVLWRMRCC